MEGVMTMTPQQASKRGSSKEKSSYAYPAQATQPATPVIKRPLTNTDLELFSRFYNNLRRGTKGLAIMSFVFFFLFVIICYGLYDVISDWTVNFVLGLFAFVIGIAAIIVSLRFVSNRKKISDVLDGGTVTEVKAPAYRNQLVPNAQAWTIGPISVMSKPGTMLNMIQEGAETTVLCIPKMKVALAINNVELINGARIICPLNLEAMAVFEQAQPQEAGEKEDINEIESAIDNSMDSNHRLAKLKELRDKGLITDEDYENKKKEILVEI
jgi:hypothetical protein